MNAMKAVRFLLTGYRPVLAAALGVALALGLLSTSLRSMPEAWHRLGVNSQPVSFGDLRVITHSIPCAAAGGDPYRAGSCDAYWAAHPDPTVPKLTVLLNYPPVWLQIGRLGVSPRMTDALGMALALAAACAFFAMLRPRTVTGGVLTLAAVLSPPVLLGVERGNIDLLVFAVVVLTILGTARRASVTRDLIRAVVIIALTVLKLYPLACVVLFAPALRGWITSTAIACVAIGVTIAAAGSRLADVLHNTPVPSYPAFGALAGLVELAKYVGSGDGAPSVEMRAIALLACVAVVAAVAAPVFARHGPRPLPALLPPAGHGDAHSDLALAGLAIFALCFVLGSSYDYRLIFLVCALPLLIDAYEMAPHWRKLCAPATIVGYMWLSRFSNYIFFSDQLISWTIFAVGGAWVLCRALRADVRGGPQAEPKSF
jgi:hypothetical protein